MRRLLAAVAALMVGSGIGVMECPAETKYGFTAFLHEVNETALGEIHEVILPNSTLYAIHLDSCLPWHEMIAGEALPQWQLDQIAGAPDLSGHEVSVAITPQGLKLPL